MPNKKGLLGRRQAIILLSGGLDSAVTLYLAKKKFKCFCLVFDYGQRHKKELNSAKRIAKVARCPLEIIKIKLPWKGSSLLDRKIIIPKFASSPVRGFTGNIPSTYVPARNIIFLSFALSYAEALKAQAIFIGAHIQDYSGYPDCRPEFYRAFSKIIATGTKTGIERRNIQIKTPLIYKNKSEIIRIGRELKVPFALTWSCYRGGKYPCGKCDSCYFRARGFREQGIEDPL
jgi:7-cyano-7-deazaguanine synthase